VNRSNVDSPLTFTYKEVDGTRVLLDVYLPLDDADLQCTRVEHCPAVVYFHGGGLTVGNSLTELVPHLAEKSVSALLEIQRRRL